MKTRGCAQAAFSLVEVALSLAILAVGMTGVLALLPVGLNSARQVHAETIAAAVVRSAIGDFSTNGWTREAFDRISQGAGVSTNQFYDVEGRWLASPQNAVFVLEFERGPVGNTNACRYFLNLSWPYGAWATNKNSPLLQNRTFVVDVVKKF